MTVLQRLRGVLKAKPIYKSIFNISIVVAGITLTLCGCAFENQTPKAYIQEQAECEPVLEINGRVASANESVRFDAQNRIYVLYRTGNQITSYHTDGTINSSFDLSNDSENTLQVVDYGIWNDKPILATNEGLVLLQDTSSPHQLELPEMSDNQSLDVCTGIPRSRFIEIISGKALFLCMSGLAPSRSILYSQLDDEWHIFYRGESSHYSGVTWTSFVAGWNGYAYMQRGKSVDKYDVNGELIERIDISYSRSSDEYPLGILQAIDANGNLYFSYSNTLRKYDTLGKLVWTQDLSVTPPLFPFIIDQYGAYYYFEYPSIEDVEISQLIKCIR